MRANFSEEQLNQITKLFNDGFGERRIAKILNVGRGRISSTFKRLGLITQSRKGKIGKDKIDYSSGKCCKMCHEIKSIEMFREHITIKRKWRDSLCSICEPMNSKKINAQEYSKEKRRQYRIDNRLEINQKIIEKSKKDLNFKLRKRLSNEIWKALQKIDYSKMGHSILEYLPFSINELKEHLEKQFEPWMTWENWGACNKKKKTWQIDHIIPHSEFNYISMENKEFKECWNLNNLRPLEAFKNASDGGTRVRHIKNK